VSNYELSEPGTVAETIDGEAVVINLERGVYFGIRGVGLAVWTDLLAGSSPEDIVASLCTRHSTLEARIRTEVSAFLDQLTNENLIRLSERTPCPPAAVAEVASYDVPSLEKYTDMEALLLMDPIHDADEQGWPNRS
jgi:hypothetical protein